MKGAINNGQSRKTGNIDEIKKQKHHTICIGHHYSQTNTNNVLFTSNQNDCFFPQVCSTDV